MTNEEKKVYQEWEIGRCQTCLTPEVKLYVYALPGVPMTVGNCRICFECSCYPWDILVGNTAAIGGMEHATDWWKDAVLVTLARLGKTVEEFVKEVEEDLKELQLNEEFHERREHGAHPEPE